MQFGKVEGQIQRILRRRHSRQLCVPFRIFLGTRAVRLELELGADAMEDIVANERVERLVKSGMNKYHRI